MTKDTKGNNIRYCIMAPLRNLGRYIYAVLPESFRRGTVL